MDKSLPLLALALCAVCAGCFDNRGRPPDATPVTSLKALAATNRADVTRLYLRGGKEAVADDAFEGLPNLKELDISERSVFKTGHARIFRCKTGDVDVAAVQAEIEAALAENLSAEEVLARLLALKDR